MFLTLWIRGGYKPREINRDGSNQAGEEDLVGEERSTKETKRNSVQPIETDSITFDLVRGRDIVSLILAN